MSKVYKINIIETLEKTIEIKATTREEALYIATDKYKGEEVILTAEDHTNTSIIVQDVEKDYDQNNQELRSFLPF